LGCVAACNADGKCVCDDGNIECKDKPIQCSGVEEEYFPEFGDKCVSNNDCAVVFHQVDCCGNQIALGINPSEVADFKEAEAICSNQYPGCGCPMGPIKADDGTMSLDKNDFSAQCVEGSCWTSAQKDVSCSSKNDCSKGQYCDFAYNTCGVWGNKGTCKAKPQACILGGPGACSCDGKSFTNGCEAAASGSDEFKYGGCELNEGTLKCGNKNCDLKTEYCIIYINDVAGPNEPEYTSNCAKYTPECIEQGKKCSCVNSEGGWCHDAGSPVVVYPGG
jgi:hypothetical protein